MRTRDPHLGKVIAPEHPTCTFTNRRSMIGVSIDRNRPLSTVVAHGACVFRAARSMEFRTT